MWKQAPEKQLDIEHCVVCRKTTAYTKETPINERIGYVVSGGSLCRDGYEDLYLKGQGFHD